MIKFFRKVQNCFFCKEKSRGMTIIDLLVVASLTVYLSVFFLKNFGQSRLNLDRATNLLISDLRLMQSYALSSKKVGDEHRCSYGITQKSRTSYVLYAGRIYSSSGSCSGRRDYDNDSGTPDLFEIRQFDSDLEFRDNSEFNDINFTSPNAGAYNDNSAISNYERIRIRKKGSSGCSSSNCMSVCIYGTGRIEVIKGSSCP